MITDQLFFKGRDVAFKSDLTQEIVDQSVVTIRQANLLLERFYECNPNAKRNRGCNSGWRPPTINAATNGAARKSKHMLGKAIDIEDSDGELDAWLMTPEGQIVLMALDLWMEHPDATPRWAHVQTVPPRSGKRVFYP